MVDYQQHVSYFHLLPKAKGIVGWLKGVVFCPSLIFLKNPSALEVLQEESLSMALLAGEFSKMCTRVGEW